LCDELYLGMQALNIAIVDESLEAQESRLLGEYIEQERTPVMTAMFVSAQSQMWVFALYEFLRTWRQRVSDLLTWADKLEQVPEGDRPATITEQRSRVEARARESRDADARWSVFERANDPTFADELRAARDKTERFFREVEAVRMSLAKHEVPRKYGMYAKAPGYGRIDMDTGSILWHVTVGNDEVLAVSRRGLADGARALTESNDRILPAAVRHEIAQLPNEGYGVKRVVAILDDGAEYAGVVVAWSTEVVGAHGHDAIPFDPARVVAVRHDPFPPRADDDDGPF
jgi:hypothetical protein